MINYFSIFEIKQSCKIVQKELDNAYILLQKKYHVDLLGQNEDIKTINNGYDILRNDFLRIKHFLALNKITLEVVAIDPFDMMDILEMQEKVESFCNNWKNDSNNLEQPTQLSKTGNLNESNFSDIDLFNGKNVNQEEKQNKLNISEVSNGAMVENTIHSGDEKATNKNRLSSGYDSMSYSSSKMLVRSKNDTMNKLRDQLLEEINNLQNYYLEAIYKSDEEGDLSSISKGFAKMSYAKKLLDKTFEKTAIL